MPKAPKPPAPKTRKASRTASTNRIAKPTKQAKPKNPKDSHLYTDDNPSTTLHGTGFKDHATAQHTLDLIKARSLTYQFQTVNTMYHRAKHHPAMRKAAPNAASTADMRAAMAVFREWLDVTYPAAKAGLRAGGFKPLLSKSCVENFLGRIEANAEVGTDAKEFARVYVGLAKGRRLGNVLVDEAKPGEWDWEARRYAALDGLVAEGKEAGEKAWGLSELWNDDREAADSHLEMIAWAWSPVAESKLP